MIKPEKTCACTETAVQYSHFIIEVTLYLMLFTSSQFLPNNSENGVCSPNTP